MINVKYELQIECDRTQTEKKRLKGILPLGIPQMTSNTHLNIHHKNYCFVYLCVCVCSKHKMMNNDFTC